MPSYKVNIERCDAVARTQVPEEGLGSGLYRLVRWWKHNSLLNARDSIGKLLLQVAQNRPHNRELTRVAWCACGMSLINIALNPPFGSHSGSASECLPRPETDRGEGPIGGGWP
jgi:hypothetical protein